MEKTQRTRIEEDLPPSAEYTHALEFVEKACEELAHGRIQAIEKIRTKRHDV